MFVYEEEIYNIKDPAGDTGIHSISKIVNSQPLSGFDTDID